MSMEHQTFADAGHHQQPEDAGSEEPGEQEDVNAMIVLRWGISRFLIHLKQRLELNNPICGMILIGE